MMLNGRGGMLRNAATPFGKLFNRNAACSCARTLKLFISGLSYDTNETALKDAFSQYGDVIAARVICFGPKIRAVEVDSIVDSTFLLGTAEILVARSLRRCNI
ncbi:hypothetical protein SETIT_1G007000v2 [Setaria italica]|uniref:RRM domain-containing protein n=1 Tax=Setaria italica TaxID=4555 RepID=A0A368PGG8_SETIT|nr:hypothetical protein SETIT_1G007000v2 [Setaria italica]